jgi:nitroreductase
MAVAALLGRRTVRAYVPDYVIPKDVLDKIVEVTLASPSGCNPQGLDLIVMTNQRLLATICETAYATWSQQMKDSLDERRKSGVVNIATCDASAVIFLVKNERASDQYLQMDAGTMIQSITIAAVELGLSTVPVAILVDGEPDKVEEILKVPKGSLVMGIAIGKGKPVTSTHERIILAKVSYVE